MNLNDYQQRWIEALYRGAADAALVTPETAHRFAAYGHGLPARFEESLRAAFPATERLVGHAFFHAAAADYARAHPSTTWDLGRVGDAFAAFLAGHAALAEHAYVAELARLEAALHDVFFMRDDAPQGDFPRDDEALAAWRPAFSPTAAVLGFAWPVLEIYEREHAPDEGWQPSPGAVEVLVFRRADGTAAARALTPAQARLQRALFDGATLADALEVAGPIDEAELAALTGLWAAEGLLRASPDR